MLSKIQLRLPAKPIWLLIGIHTFFLSVGFWFLYQLLISSTEYQAVETAWNDLAARSKPLIEAAADATADELSFNSRLSSHLKSLASAVPEANRTGVLVVGHNGNLLQPLSDMASKSWKPGERIAWTQEQQSLTAGAPSRGRLVTPEGNRPAISFPLGDGKARLVFYEGNVPGVPWRTTLLAGLPLAVGVSFLWTWLLSSVATYLMSARLHFEQAHWKALSEHNALRSAQDLLRTRDAVIFGLAKLAESRDPETGHHLERISLYCTRLANALRLLPKYQDTVTPGFIRLLGISSVLHDIGKVGLEDTVLLKPGRLNADERKKMQEHTLVAGACLREIEQRLGESNFLQTAREIALHHHERWDGNGYPAGLVGESIPLAARIVTVADVYDALSSKRVYKDAFPHEECVRLIREGAGTQFDPELVDVFLSIEADFAAIAHRLASPSSANLSAMNPTPLEERGVMSPSQEAVLREVITNPVAAAEKASRSSSLA